MNSYQQALFGGLTPSSPRVIDLGSRSILEFFEQIIPEDDADAFFDALRTDIRWQQDHIRFFRKPLPRLTAWYGDKGSHYSYSGIGMNPLPWTPILSELRKLVEEKSGCKFNSVLLNLYRSGSDSISWHTDDEKELGPNPTIASLSFGGPRFFDLRRTENHAEKLRLELTSGSLLVMRGTTQKYWQHSIAKTSKFVGERINLTFRYIHVEGEQLQN